METSAAHVHQTALIEAMQRPEFYPHATDPKIRLVQTHLSYVLLTGPYAYKIGKCVQLSFADYSTLEKRRHFCEEEIRLNRLYAPDLYLNVVTIRKGANGFTLSDGETEAVEYAVKMRQFRDEDLLLHVFERGELTMGHVEFIARQIVRFHSEAKTDAEIAAYGAPESVATMVHDNLESLAPSAGAFWCETDLDRLRRFSRNALDLYHDLLQHRADAGHVRECHGDLHLGNICLYNGRIEFFDRIVFNDGFKNIDVMYDLAFLYMDLEYRGRPDMANRLLNVYLETSNEFDGVRLVPFYACCRAQIRAKVFAIEAGEEEIPAADRPAIEREAKSYFDLALQYAADPKRAPLTMMCGVAGSGKSTVARELAARTGAVCFRSDAVRKKLAESSTDLYSPDTTERTYTFLIEGGAKLAACGFPVILDATFLERAHRRRALAACHKSSLEARIVHCIADTATLEQRVQHRSGDVSDADTTVLHDQLDRFEPISGDEMGIVTELDTTKPIDYSKL